MCSRSLPRSILPMTDIEYPAAKRSLTMTTTQRALVVIGAALMAPIASASDADGNYAIRGPGSSSCEAYTEAFAEEDVAAVQSYAAWIDGYRTSRSRVADETYDVLPFEQPGSVASILRGVCEQNPEILLETAMHGVLELFEPVRQARDSEIRELERDGNTVRIREETLREVQRQLAERDLYDFEIDGAYGPGTANGLAQFQAQAGLAETGLPDSDTLLALFLGRD